MTARVGHSLSVIEFTGLNALLGQMELTKTSDAYMPGAALYIEITAEKRLVGSQQSTSYHIPIITVPKGNPACITRLEDLARPGAKLIWGIPKLP